MNCECKKHKLFFWTTVAITLLAMLLIALPTIIIDPFFHYQKPISNNGYELSKQRYINDGIVRHFDYDALIVGTSMMENFKTSEASELFGYDFVKVPYCGGFYKELDQLVQRSYSSKNDIKMIIRCLDYSLLVQDKDAEHEEVDPLNPQFKVPDYLTNMNPFDDVKYVLNKDVLFGDTYSTYMNIKNGVPTTSFDEYSNWSSDYEYGRLPVLDTYEHTDVKEKDRVFTDADYKMTKENVEKNVISIINEHPETTFYLFFSPYSICYWDEANSQGTINWYIDAEKVAIELLLECPNVKLFSFTNDFDTVCNLDNYRDQIHYGEWYNSTILERMKSEEYMLTKENYLDYLEEIRSFYNNYDYSIFAADYEG